MMMTLNELKQRLKEIDNQEIEQLKLLQQFIDGIEAQTKNLDQPIKFSDFMEFCELHDKASLFTDSYLNSGSEDAKLYKNWQQESLIYQTEEEKKVVLTNYPSEVLFNIFGFLNKAELQNTAGSCQLAHGIINHNESKLVHQAAFPHVDYTKPWIDTQGKYQQEFTFKENAYISSLTFGINGDLACGFENGVIQILDPKTGKCKQVLLGHNQTDDSNKIVASLTFAPNGYLISASYDKTVRIWDPNTGECKQVLSGHEDCVMGVAVSAKGLIASSSMDGTIRIWDLNTGECKQVLRGHEGMVFSAVFDENGRIISGSEDETIRIWDLNTGECLKILEGHKASIFSVVVHKKFIISSSDDNNIRIWDLNTGACLKKLKSHECSVETVAVEPNTGDIISGSSDNTIRIWDANTWEEKHRLNNKGSWLLAVSPNGNIASPLYYKDENGKTYEKLHIWRFCYVNSNNNNNNIDINNNNNNNEGPLLNLKFN